MKIDLSEVVWLDEQQMVGFAELVESSGLSEAELRELVEDGVLVPHDPDVQWTFSARYVATVRAATRLRDDFDLAPNALALTLRFLDHIHELEAQLRELRAQLPQRRS
ncbi:MAG: hypothetical protein KGZ83_14675 [Sulfuricella sp.]|nr:hypothetical protein [Sulfuricella sp.]